MDVAFAQLICCLDAIAFLSNHFHSSTSLQLNSRMFPGEKCSRKESDDVLWIPEGCDPATLSAATLEFDYHNPQKGDEAVVGPGAPGAGWYASIQPIPKLHTLLASAWRAKTMF